MHHYPSKGAYDSWRGTSFTPHNMHSLAPQYQMRAPRSATALPLLFEHRKRLPDGGVWHVRRVGPFVSRGGFDWWQMQARDVFGLREVLDTHGSVFIVETSMEAGQAPG